MRTSSRLKWKQQTEKKLLRVYIVLNEKLIEQKTVSAETLNHKDRTRFSKCCSNMLVRLLLIQTLQFNIIQCKT